MSYLVLSFIFFSVPNLIAYFLRPRPKIDREELEREARYLKTRELLATLEPRETATVKEKPNFRDNGAGTFFYPGLFDDEQAREIIKREAAKKYEGETFKTLPRGAGSVNFFNASPAIAEQEIRDAEHIRLYENKAGFRKPVEPEKREIEADCFEMIPIYRMINLHRVCIGYKKRLKFKIEASAPGD